MWLILYELSSLLYILIIHTPISSRPTYYRARAALIYIIRSSNDGVK